MPHPAGTTGLCSCHAGEPPGDYYKLEPRPASELDEAAKATHRDAVGPVYPSGTEPPNWDRDADDLLGADVVGGLAQA
eukprot:CAMPEP_0177596322 /NCGR_PEP_ID=MMETSP0419_2-20121207/10976_1 /TAXON_ID=582737 /ORGANISM="Tetraselmis sp., Strain GSL018" /LENGTH=77 /DNA_ID=CAMNT_0019088137 /DNA_START=332 /DNA_END=566 /DNA_ORIENTATION=+